MTRELGWLLTRGAARAPSRPRAWAAWNMRDRTPRAGTRARHIVVGTPGRPDGPYPSRLAPHGQPAGRGPRRGPRRGCSISGSPRTFDVHGWARQPGPTSPGRSWSRPTPSRRMIAYAWPASTTQARTVGADLQPMTDRIHTSEHGNIRVARRSRQKPTSRTAIHQRLAFNLRGRRKRAFVFANTRAEGVTG